MKKTTIAPNECSTKRWLAVLAVGVIGGLILTAPLSPLLENRTDSFMGIAFADLFGVLSFIPLFVCLVLAVRFVGKTSFQDFVLGVGGKVRMKDCLLVLGLYGAGFAVSCLLTLKNIRLRQVDGGQFSFLVLFMLLTAWMQTTWEELVYRGVFLRWACKNQVGFTKKALLAAAVSSVVFALSHITNPEVTSQSGIRVAMMMISYAIPGFVSFLANLHFGNLLPGILIHWLNNFTLFTLISTENSAVPVPTLLIDGTPNSALWSLISTVIAYLPVVVYLLAAGAKKRKSAAIR